MYEKLESASSINLPVANEISEKILCLPIYPDLEMADVEDIAKVIKNALQ